MTWNNARIDLRRAIRRLGVDTTLVLQRFGSGARVAGRWEDPRPVTSAISACVQAADGETKLLLPENLRTQDAIEIWSDSEIRPLKQVENKPPDRVLWGGKPYEAYTVEDWSPNGRYWYALCYRVDA